MGFDACPCCEVLGTITSEPPSEQMGLCVTIDDFGLGIGEGGVSGTRVFPSCQSVAPYEMLYLKNELKTYLHIDMYH